jgi:hypothetical protein
MAADRGSAKLAARFDEAKLKNVISELKKLGLNPDIIINGKPKPDIIKGTFTAPSNTKMQAGLKLLLGIENAQYKPVKLFPKGTPRPDIFEISFEAKATIAKAIATTTAKTKSK